MKSKPFNQLFPNFTQQSDNIVQNGQSLKFAPPQIVSDPEELPKFNIVGDGSCFAGSIPPEIPDCIREDLLFHWTLNEEYGPRMNVVDNNCLHLSPPTLDHPFRNNPLLAAGKLNDANYFQSINQQCLFLIDYDELRLTNINDFTIACWVFLNAKDDKKTILFKRNEYWLYYDNVSDRFKFQVNKNTIGQTVTVAADSLGSPDINTWYYLQVRQITREDHSEACLQIRINNDGWDSTPDGSYFVGDTYNLWVGGNDSDTASGYWDGYLDELSIWHRALDSTELDTLYNDDDYQSPVYNIDCNTAPPPEEIGLHSNTTQIEDDADDVVFRCAASIIGNNLYCLEDYKEPTGTIVIGNHIASGGQVSAALLFRGLQVPIGTSLNSARIIFKAVESNSGPVNLQIRALWSTTGEMPVDLCDSSLVTHSTTKVFWNNVATWLPDTDVTSPDISTILQEIIDSEYYTPTANFLIYIENIDSSPDAYRIAEGYATALPMLGDISYISNPLSNGPILDLWWDYIYIATGGMVLSGPATATIDIVVPTPSGGIILSDATTYLKPINKDFIFRWGFNQDRLHYYRVESNCRPRNLTPADTSSTCGSFSKITTLVLARSLQEVCQKLTASDWVFPVYSVHRIDPPALYSERLDTDSDDRVLVDVTDDFNEVSVCSDFFVDVVDNISIAAFEMTINDDLAEFTSTGGITLTDNSNVLVTFNESDSFIDQTKGQIVLSGEVDPVSSAWEYRTIGGMQLSASNNILFHPIVQDIAKLNLGGDSESIIDGTETFDMNSNITMTIDNNVNFNVDTTARQLTGSRNRSVTAYCCPNSLSYVQMYIYHNLHLTQNLFQFLNRNNLTLPNPIPISYKESTNNWQNVLSFTGVPNNNTSTSGSWKLFFDCGCVSTASNGSTSNLNGSFWQFSFNAIYKDHTTNKSATTRLLLFFDNDSICQTNTSSKVQFNFNVQTQQSYPLSVLTPVFNDGAGLFKSAYWSKGELMHILVKDGSQTIISSTTYPELVLPIQTVRGSNPSGKN